jgi:hypothetical protein
VIADTHVCVTRCVTGRFGRELVVDRAVPTAQRWLAAAPLAKANTPTRASAPASGSSQGRAGRPVAAGQRVTVDRPSSSAKSCVCAVSTKAGIDQTANSYVTLGDSCYRVASPEVLWTQPPGCSQSWEVPNPGSSSLPSGARGTRMSLRGVLDDSFGDGASAVWCSRVVRFRRTWMFEGCMQWPKSFRCM